MTTPATSPLPAIALHKLPVQLRMLVRVMGEAGAYKLVQWRGGTPYTVPKGGRAAQVQELVDGVGAEAAAALIAAMPGETLQLPKYDSVTRQLRHQRVVELRQRQVKLHEIALATGYTVRQAINIINRAGLPMVDGDGSLGPEQADLFGFGDGAVVRPVSPAPPPRTVETLPTAHDPFNQRPRPAPPTARKARQAV